VAHPAYLREKALQMRREKGLTVDELAERLALSRSTIYYWVRDIPIERKPGRGFATKAQRLGTRAMQKKYERRRELAYNAGRHSFHAHAADPTFRDFVSMYIGEGYKRSRNKVSLGNSDPQVVELATHWITKFTRNTVAYSLQYHADQDLEMLRGFWGNRLGVEPDAIRLQRKSNSNQLTGRTWRSKFGVLTVSVGDTQLRARIQGWIDEMQRSWLDSAGTGRSEAW
jgi:transposase-like protein